MDVDPVLMIVLGCVALAWWFAAAVLVQKAALSRGYESGGWFAAGVIFGPVIAPLILLCHPPRPSDVPVSPARSLSILAK